MKIFEITIEQYRTTYPTQKEYNKRIQISDKITFHLGFLPFKAL
jgi:hypothetical protein